MAKKESKPKVHEELNGLSFEVDEFGEIKSSYEIDKINQFLNKNVDDKKFREREDLDEIKGPPNGQSGWVIVEPMNILPSDSKEVINTIPYKYRRKKWGQAISVAYSLFYPDGLESNVGALNFDDVYDKSAETPMTEIQFNIKRNMSIGSLAVEIGLGFYSNDSDSDLVDSSRADCVVSILR